MADRRAPLEAHLELDPDPKKLRESLERATDALPPLEPDTARKVRHLIAEIIARSFGSETATPICLDIAVLSTAVRVEAYGAQVSPERWKRGGEDDPPFPAWAIDDLADSWDVDRRTEGPAVWFCVERRGE